MDASPYTPDALRTELSAVLICNGHPDNTTGRLVCRGSQWSMPKLVSLRLSAQYRAVPGERRVFQLLGHKWILIYGSGAGIWD